MWKLKLKGATMKFLFDRDALLKELALAQEIIASKNAISILSNVLFVAKAGTLLIRATDLQTSFETRLPVEIQDEGTTTVFCDKLVNILSTLPEGEIEFSQEDNNVVIKPAINPKKMKSQLRSMASEKYPDFTFDTGAEFFDVPAKDLKDMVAETIFSVSTDISRYFMTGVYFEKEGDKLNLVSTDGKRLAFAARSVCQNAPDFSPAIVPPKILSILQKRAPTEGNVAMAFADKQLRFKFGAYQFSSNLVEGQFPNYRKVIPDAATHFFEVNKEDLLGALRRVGLFVEEKTKKIIFQLSPGTLTVWSAESDLGSAKEELPCEYNGDEITLAFPTTHISEPLKVIEGERIHVDFTEEQKAVVLKTESAADFFYVIMPMQV
jgi:DNA polymerase-3 subunit beta